MTDFTYRVMEAVMRLGKEAYGVPLQEELGVRNRIYTKLASLERAGFLEAEWSEPTAERGGRRKRIYRLTGLGESAIAQAQQERAFRAGAVLS